MFTLPEDFASLPLEEQRALLTQAIAARDELLAIPEADLTDEQLDQLDAAVAAIAEVRGSIATTEQAAQARADRIAAAKASKDADADDATDEEPEDGDDGDDDEEEDVDVPDDASELEEQEAVVAGGQRSGAIGAVARGQRRPRRQREPEPPSTSVAITAAANLPKVTQGTTFKDMREVASAFADKGKGYARRLTPAEHALGEEVVHELSSKAQRAGIAKFARDGFGDLDVRAAMSTQEQMDVVMRAASESRLPGGGVIAAGGWCAPSETLYGNFLTLETASGLLSIPEVVANRGGINFTKGPDYASIAAAWGFMQTEAQAEAGTTKTCYDVACPPFSEVRLDAIGFCVKAGVLTEAAYPELIDRVLQIGTVAHAHKVNASVISRISTYIGAAIAHAEIGATTNDVLDALALQASRIRYTYSMDPNATIEAVAPLWLKEIIRADLGRRTGVDSWLAITDAQIQSFLGVRGIAMQFVYDYQNLTSGTTTTWTKYPATVDVMLYPAGSFVKLTDAVLDLDTIYDSVGLSTNTFTAAFFEEGLAVANTGASGVKVTIDIASLHGRSGAANVGSAVTP